MGPQPCSVASSRCPPEVSMSLCCAAGRRRHYVDQASKTASTAVIFWKISSCRPTRRPDTSCSVLLALACRLEHVVDIAHADG